MKTSSEIRTQFLEFFANKNHTIVNSAPVVNYEDPTLMFTNAGMNQFKDVFLGTGSRSYTRVADTQKCIRVSGKHNDLEEVGLDTYHHTFFEMLGNWSFGDYFKEDAIKWAWELLVDVWKIPQEKIWATVFSGSEEDGVERDTEAEELWKKHTSIAHDRILGFGKKDNFWEMGDTGPCGPCSEIHVDLGQQMCTCPDKKCRGVNADCPRFVEIWNLVFIQYNRREDGKLVTLPAKHVDTGMGFERLLALLQGKTSNYDTDLFTPIIDKISELSGKTYSHGFDKTNVAFRVVADHVRTLCMAFVDGALPSNEGRGYVLRRILRRAAKYGDQQLEMKEPFIYKLVPVVAEIYKEIFPEIGQRQQHISLLIQSEEESFARTLSRGIGIFLDLAKDLKEQNKTVIPGEKAYELYSQDGFPRDLVELMAREENLSVDSEGWHKAEEEHKEKSRSDKFKFNVPMSEIEGLPATKFVGQSQFEIQAKILKLIDTDKIILDRTSFYAEGGGQVGDTGIISGKGFSFVVHDTQKIGDIFIHHGELQEGDLSNLPNWVNATIDKGRRWKIMSNHTATHLLHAALREVLGDHVTQQGSLVAPEKLRFDVSHPSKITSEEITAAERWVNRIIYNNIRVTKRIESLETAKQKGAMALFGEKYGDKVRVVSIGPHSMELCGGTHVFFTGGIGYFKIVSESAVQTGVRRIEAVTRDTAVEDSLSQNCLIEQVQGLLKVKSHQDILSRISSLQEEVRNLKKKHKQESQHSAKHLREKILEEAKEVGNCKIVLRDIPNSDVETLRDLADSIRKSGTPSVGILTTVKDSKVAFVAFVGDKLKDNESLHAGEFVKKLCGILGGGGNTNRKDFAQGQGKDASKLQQAFSDLYEFISGNLG